ncbi:hypothetical protein [Microbacterium sp. CFBP9034]|uniref:hypothetical protein n=1 Tax=Microbacterium sp. CFBP9034 TaxID=3096540 RepID=UPI002A6A0C0D|nr:hypothetical protein [Microbacterium sp. CFBP9034]MDY0909663.1 hypothetical protein [Microbacterium sp. CFBP9034]
MSCSQRSGAAIAAAAVIAAVLLMAGCAGPVVDEGQTETSQGPTDIADDTDDEGEGDEGEGDEGEGEGEGDEDPEQDLVRTGPVAEYGGPAYGDQGEAEIVEDGVWCKTIAVFWGGSEPVPEGVRFTFEQAVPDRGGLDVESGVCGTSGADRSCIDMPAVEANESGIFCSIVVRPTAEFQDGTSITFTGTLECPTREICDAVVARDVVPGPPIVVNTPEGA